MPHSRSWTAPPTRRELTLLLFSLTIFVLSYNLEASLGIVGVHPQKLTASYLSSLGLGSKDPGFDVDGRRPKEWRDELENIIAGEWEWREGEVSGVARGSAAMSGLGRTGMLYNFGGVKKVSRSLRMEDRGVSLDTGVTVKDQSIKWGKNVPETTVVAHTPGYTVLDNVIAVNGTLFVVANDWTKVPKLTDIASSSLDTTKPPRVQDWHILTTHDAAEMFGPYAAKIHGTSWLALGTAESQDPYTLLSLFRTHASASSSAPSSSFTSSSGLHIITPPSSSSPSSPSIPAPLRVIYPYIPTFSSPNVPPGPGEDPKAHPPPRERAYTGMHPLLPKVVLPTLAAWYLEDWMDLAEMHVPFLLERVVIADRGAAERGRAAWIPAADAARVDEMSKRAPPTADSAPVWSAPFVGLTAPEGWWTPARAALLRYLHIVDGSIGSGSASESRSLWGLTKKQVARKPIVTYVSMQDAPAGAGARLSGEDHERLVRGLQALEEEGVLGEVHVLKGNGSVPAPEWEERMSAIARTTILMGPYGFQLADGVFMRSPLGVSAASASAQAQKQEDAPPPPPAPLLMEFFPPGTFVRSQQYAMQALEIDYMAWWNGQIFTGNNLPDVAPAPSSGEQYLRVALDVDAVLRTVREQAPRRVA